MAGIKVTLNGFKQGQEFFKRITENFGPVVGAELKTWTQENVDWMKEKVLGDDMGLAPKKRDDGKPPLIDTENYINSYMVFPQGFFSIGILSVGMNTFMSNEDLAEILEYGWKNGPARPHLRPMIVYMRNRANVLGERIVTRLFGSA
jgi:hypothetical protein